MFNTDHAHHLKLISFFFQVFFLRDFVILIFVIGIATPALTKPGIQSRSISDPNDPCVSGRGIDINVDRIPSDIRSIQCKQGNDCHEIRAAMAVGFKNNKSIHVLDVVISCQKRLTCGGTRNIKSNYNSTRTPRSLIQVSCPHKTQELFMKIPVFYSASGNTSGKTLVVFEKIVYDCRCKCPPKT